MAAGRLWIPSVSGRTPSRLCSGDFNLPLPKHMNGNFTRGRRHYVLARESPFLSLPPKSLPISEVRAAVRRHQIILSRAGGWGLGLGTWRLAPLSSPLRPAPSAREGRLERVLGGGGSLGIASAMSRLIYWCMCAKAGATRFFMVGFFIVCFF